MIDLDTRAHDAATAARLSVAGMRADHHLPPPRHKAMWVIVAGATVAAVAAFALATSGDVTHVATVPSQPAPTLTGPPGPPPPPPDLGISGRPGSEFLRGTARDGRAWAFYFGGPSNELCFGVDLLIRSMAGGACLGAPGGGPAPDQYRPLFFNDTRAPFFVAGRAPEGVTEVSVLLVDGTVTPRHPVVVVAEGRFYVVELPGQVNVQAVVGYRRDGSSVRLER